MNEKESVKLVFETISKIVGFEIKPYKEFYIVENDIKTKYLIDENFNLHYKTPHGYFKPSEYNILPIFKGGYKLEEIQEPLLTEEEKEFLRNFKFDELLISKLLYLCIFSKTNDVIVIVQLNNINHSFNRLKIDRRYSRKELGL